MGLISLCFLKVTTCSDSSRNPLCRLELRLFNTFGTSLKWSWTHKKQMTKTSLNPLPAPPCFPISHLYFWPWPSVPGPGPTSGFGDRLRSAAGGTEKTWLFGLSGNSKAGNYCRTFKGVLWDTVILYYGICHMICHAMAAIYGCHNNINIYYHCTWFDRTLKTCDLAIISSPHGEHSPRTPGYVSVWWGSDLPTATRGWKWFFFNHLILGLWQSILLMGETFSKDLGPLGLGGTQHISASPHRTMMVFGRKTNLLRWFRFVGEKSTCCLYPQFIKSTFLYMCLAFLAVRSSGWFDVHFMASPKILGLPLEVAPHGLTTHIHKPWHNHHDYP